VLYYAKEWSRSSAPSRSKGRPVVSHERQSGASSHLQAQQVQYALGHLPCFSTGIQECPGGGNGERDDVGGNLRPSERRTDHAGGDRAEGDGGARTFQEYIPRPGQPELKIVSTTADFLLTTKEKLTSSRPTDSSWFRARATFYTPSTSKLAAEHLRPAASSVSGSRSMNSPLRPPVRREDLPGAFQVYPDVADPLRRELVGSNSPSSSTRPTWSGESSSGHCRRLEEGDDGSAADSSAICDGTEG